VARANCRVGERNRRSKEVGPLLWMAAVWGRRRRNLTRGRNRSVSGGHNNSTTKSKVGNCEPCASTVANYRGSTLSRHSSVQLEGLCRISDTPRTLSRRYVHNQRAVESRKRGTVHNNNLVRGNPEGAVRGAGEEVSCTDQKKRLSPVNRM